MVISSKWILIVKQKRVSLDKVVMIFGFWMKKSLKSLEYEATIGMELEFVIKERTGRVKKFMASSAYSIDELFY